MDSSIFFLDPGIPVSPNPLERPRETRGDLPNQQGRGGRNPANQLVDRLVVEIPLFTRLYIYIQTVVGLGISGRHQQYFTVVYACHRYDLVKRE